MEDTIMYDSVFMYYNKLTNSDKTYLYDISERSKDKTIPDHIRFIDNIRLEFSQDRKTVRIRGSLAKYYLGNNFDSLSIHTTQEAVESLSDKFKLPLKSAKLTRLDVGYVFKMNSPVRQYQDSIWGASYLERTMRENTLYLENKSRILAFYDKEQEALDKGITIPEPYLHSHLLRYECRYKDNLPNKLKRDEVTCRLLYDQDFFNQMIDNYISEFQNVVMFPGFIFKSDRKLTPSEVKDLYFTKLMYKAGPNSFYSHLKQLKDQNIFIHDSDYNVVKNGIYGMLDSYSIDTAFTLVDELTQKVESVGEMFASPAIV